MGLYQDVEVQIKDAMKSQQAERLLALRNMKAALKYKAIDLKRDLNDDEVIAVLSMLSKQRRESIEMFSKGGRADLVQKEEAELKVIEEFLPQQLGAEELDAIIKAAIAEAGAAGPQDMGKVMKVLKPKTAGRADGTVVSNRVKALLSGG